MKKLYKIVHQTSWLLFVAYILLLSYFLFFSEKYGRVGSTADYRYNLHLFQEIRRFIIYRNELGMESFVVNIFGNILAFAPFGFWLPFISRKNRKILNIAVLSFEFSLCIEIIQLLFKVGIFDVDDIFMNTVGGVLGYLLFLISQRYYYKYHHERKK